MTPKIILKKKKMTPKNWLVGSSLTHPKPLMLYRVLTNPRPVWRAVHCQQLLTGSNRTLAPIVQYIPLLCPSFLLRFTVICLVSTKIYQTTQNKNQRSKKNHLHQWQPTQKEHKTKLGGTRRLATRVFCRVMLFTRYRYIACHQRKIKENWAFMGFEALIWWVSFINFPFLVC